MNLDWHLEQPTRIESLIEGLNNVKTTFSKAQLKLQEGTRLYYLLPYLTQR